MFYLAENDLQLGKVKLTTLTKNEAALCMFLAPEWFLLCKVGERRVNAMLIHWVNSKIFHPLNLASEKIIRLTSQIYTEVEVATNFRKNITVHD